jgi:hypothetical protein
MSAEKSKLRYDEQLAALLDKAGSWTVNGARDTVFCEATSLRGAIERAAELAARGREIVAVVHRPRPEIVVFAGQLQRLTNNISKTVSSPDTSRAWQGETEIRRRVSAAATGTATSRPV